MENKYYIGLDVGTESVGWAVTDENYNIKRFKGNAMWGIRLFDESETSQKRRMFRTARRRLDRRGARLGWLEEIFAEEICKIDPEFFVRMKESPLHYEDKRVKGKYAIFAGGYTDKDYFKAYPTVYRLRRELIENPAPHDIRLVYLALHHIIKYRGHFLFEELSVQEIKQFSLVFEALVQYCIDNYADEGDAALDFTCQNASQLEQVLRSRRLGKTAKRTELAKVYGITKKTDPRRFACLGLLSGCSESLSDIYGDDALKEAEIKKITFAEKFEENRESYASLLGERFELLEMLKAVYDWAVLADKLDGENYLSIAMDKKYREHAKDLADLKAYVKAYLPKDTYYEIFKLSKDKLCNYVAYSGHAKKNGKTDVLRATATQEEFCAYLKKTLGKCQNTEKYAALFEKIENGTFCPKLRSAGNGTIPMQLHRMELEKILHNAASYLPFLNVADETDKTPAQKVLAIFDYKIPYYVGPLNEKSPNKWLVRSSEKITPWNIEDVVDFDASAVKFIENLTNQCSYLPQEDVLPQNSILYSKFMVLNAINALKIDGEAIPVELKQMLFTERFLVRNKVTKKTIVDFLKSKGIEFTTLTGIDDDPGCCMKPWRDMERLAGFSEAEKDDIIKDITIFGEEKRMLKKRLQEKYETRLSSSDIGFLAKLNYSGWGRLSEKFLTEVLSVDKETGELVNIITALWQTNLNLMQLLYSERFAFGKAVEEAAKETQGDSMRKAVEQLYVSPKIKRPIYQALLIVKEIVKTQGCAPAKIFLEVARGEGEKKRTKSRKTQLQELYAAFKKEYPAQWAQYCRDSGLESKLSDIQEDRLRSDKIFLYFTQLGRCMYTFNPIDLEALIQGNSSWDIDHIYPQSKIKDDSLHNNRVLAEKTYNNKVKGADYPLPASTRANMRPFWDKLLKSGLITSEKYNRLICPSELTDEQLSAFINRQLVETRQSTKAIAGILQECKEAWKEKYGICDTDIVYVKAGLVSEFRQTKGQKDSAAGSFVKCRDVNDLHHAKDAYLNIVVGNVYDVQCRKNYKNFISGLKDGSRSMNGIFRYRVPGAWEPGVTLATVEKYMAKNNILYTRYSFKNKGELFKQQPVKKGTGQVPLKAIGPRSRMEAYGAYNSATTYCYCLAKHGKAGKQKIGLFAINLYEKERYFSAPLEYLRQRYRLLDPAVLIPVINIQSCLSFDGFRVHLGGKNSRGEKVVYRPAVQLVVDAESERYIKKIFKFFESNRGNKSTIATVHDGVSKEDNQALYGLLVHKMQNKIYGVIFKDLADDLEKSRDNFENMAVEAQCRILWELVNILHCNAGTGNLKAINISADGKIRRGCNISENGFHSVKLIHQSITGLYEHQIELLNM